MKKVISFGLIILVALGIIMLSIQTTYSYFQDNGYVTPDANISDILSAREVSSNDDISLIPTKENEEYKERLGSYYDENDEAIDLDFPLIIKDGTALRFINGGAYLIDDDFNYSEVSRKSIISDQTCFGDDGQIRDTGSYMMVQLENKLFASTTNIKVQTELRTYSVDKNSLFFFGEEYANAYEYKDGKYKFVSIRGLNNAKIYINDKEMTYAAFYKKLLKVEDSINDYKVSEDEVKADAKDQIKKEKKKTSGKKPTPAADPIEADAPADAEMPQDTPVVDPPQEIEPGPVDPGETLYVKPTVNVSDISAWVYTINGQIKINDPSSRISGGVVFYVYDEDGHLVMRQSVKKSGLLDISILEPDSYYSVTARFDYYNEKNNKKTETVLEPTVVHTLPIKGNVSPVKLSFDVDETALPYTMLIDNAKLENTTDYDSGNSSLSNFYKNVIPYVARVTITFTDADGKETTCNVQNSILSNLKKGETLNFETIKVLESDTNYTYKVNCYDKFGNQLSFDPEISGKYKTSKKEPKVTATVISSNQDAVSMRVTLDDLDETLLDEGYVMRIYNGDQLMDFEYTYNGATNTGNKIEIDTAKPTVDIVIKSLPYATKLKAVFTGNYDLKNGQGVFKDAIIGSLDFYSGSLPNGSIYYTNQFKDIGGTFASMDLTIQRSSTTELVSLLTDLSFTIKGGAQSIEQKISETQFDSVDVDDNYDEDGGYLVIQEGDADEQIPEILLYATKDAIKSQGAWQTFLNTGILGESNDLSGKVTVTYVSGTLTTLTKYSYSMTSNIYISGSDHDITTNYTSTNFSTLASDVVVGYGDFFLAENFIEIYDIYSIDVDKVILNNTFYLQLVEDGEVVNSEKLQVGEKKDVVRFDNLKVGHEYTLRFMAPDFNQGSDDTTYEKNHIIDEYDFIAEEGVSASINLTNIRSGYESKAAAGTFVANIGEGITEGQTYNTSTRTMVDDENRFVTDFIPFETGKTSIFQDFGVPERSFYIIGYNANKQYVTYTNPSRANFYTFDKRCNSGWLTNSNIKYIRIVGYTGFEKNARFYQVDTSNCTALVDLKTDPDAFVDGVNPGTNGFDSANLSVSSTEYIDVTPGDTLLFTSNRTRYLYFYDKDHKYITSRGGGASDYGGCEVPAQAVYARYAITSLDKDNDTEEAVLYRVTDSQVKDYVGTINWSIKDDSDDQFTLSDVLADKNYYIKKYISNSIEKIDYNEKYNHKNELVVKTDGSIDISEQAEEDLEAGKAFKYELIVKYHNREIVLSSYEFSTENKIYLLKNAEDLKYIQYDTYATFIALNDITEEANYAPVNGTFGGTIDFQGHTLTFNYSSNYFIYYLTPKGVIKNINIVYNRSMDRGLICSNLGTLKDFTYTVNLGEDDKVMQSLVYYNEKNGVISNFAVKLCGDVTVYNEKTSRQSTILVRSNYGKITNGYIYNTVKGAHVNLISAPKSNGTGNGVLTASSNDSAVISNIYSTIDIYCDYNQNTATNSAGIIAGVNSGRTSNIFGVGSRYYFSYDPDNDAITNHGESTLEDPLFGYRSGKMTSDDGSTETGLEYRYENIYFQNENGTTYDPRYTYSEGFDLSNLYDTQWYNTNIQSEGQFDIADNVAQGFYPLITKTDGGLVTGQTLSQLPELETYEAPTALGAVVSKETTTYVDVVFKFENSGKRTISELNVEGVDTQIQEQKENNGVYEVKARLSNPTMYVTGYNLKSFKYRTTAGYALVNCDIEIKTSFYKTIDSIDEWADFLGINGKNKHLNYNYRLTNNLDFSSVSSADWFKKYVVNGTFTGHLDGGQYDEDGNLTGRFVLQEIHIGDTNNSSYHYILLNALKFATIKNLDIRDVDWNKPAACTSSNLGLIYNMEYSTVDNVHINNIELTARSYIGVISCLGVNSTIKNCSTNNAKIRTNPWTNNVIVGGLIGQAGNMQIKNCYTANVDISTDQIDLSYTVGIGGLVGYSYSNSRIENCYTTGQIKSTSYVGGVVGIGSFSVDRCYSDVYIETDGDYNGGIAASTDLNNASVQNSFSVGSFVYAMSSPKYTNRIMSVQPYWWLNNNYGYKYQTFNNQMPESTDVTGILDYQDFTVEKTYTDSIRLKSTDYDFSNVDEGILPQLKSTTGELLPYQENHYLTSGQLSAEVMISKYDGTTYYNTEVRVKHEGYEVDEVMIEGMQLMDGYPQKKDTGSSTTSYYVLKTTRTMAFDVYRMRVKVHLKADPSQTKVLTVSVDYHDPVYWVIHDANEWQEVMSSHGNTNENIMIAGTLDFSGISNPITNVVVNRLEGDTLAGTPNVIKNLTLRDATKPYFVNTVYSNINDLTFQNVNVEIPVINPDTRKEQTLAKSAGIVNIVQGDVKNLNFESCSITDDSSQAVKVSATINLGMLCMVGGSIDDCTINNITIKAKSNNTTYRYIYTGGLVGKMTNGMSNIKASNIHVDVDHGYYTGGIVGFASKTTSGAMYITGLSLEKQSSTDSNSEIKGTYCVGGLIGYDSGLTFYDSYIKDVDVSAYYNPDDSGTYDGSYVGGMIGYGGALIANDEYTGYNVENVTVAGGASVGNAIGYCGDATRIKVKNSQSTGNAHVGGVIGSCGGTANTCRANNVTATGNYAVGGITGSCYNVYYSNVLDSTIKTQYYGGGLSGLFANYNSTTDTFTRRNGYSHENMVLNTNIRAEKGYAGGIVGRAYMNNGTNMYKNNVKGCTVYGGSEGHVGGFAGELDAGNFYLSYVVDTDVSSPGNYVGGLAGNLVWNDSDFSSKLYRSYSHATVDGANYVGGLFGNLESTTTSQATAPQLFGLVNASTVTGTGSNVYAIGNVVNGSMNGMNPSYYGGIVSYDKATVNGAKISDGTLSNYKDDTKLKIMTAEQLTDYTTLTGSLANNYLSMDGYYWNYFITTAVKLENFAISFKGLDGNYGSNKSSYVFDLSGIDLRDGTYGIRAIGTNNAKYVEGQSVEIKDGKISDFKFKYGSATSQISVVFTIYDSETKEDYCQATIYNCHPNYTTYEVTADGGSTMTNYKYEASPDKPITLKIIGGNDYTWKWYRVYNGNGYSRNYNDVTAVADGDSLTTNVAGVYYAQATSGNRRTQLFTYDTYVYYPMSSSYLTNMSYQNGYKNGESTYKTSMNYTGAIPFEMATKMPKIHEQEEEEIVLPTYSAYASGASTVNLEFDNTVAMNVDNPKFQVTLKSGDSTKTYDVTSRVMTFDYDFKENLVVTVEAKTQPDNNSSIIFNTSSLRQSISLYGDNYYFITSDGVRVNDNDYKGEFTHIYRNKGIKLVDGTPTLWDLDSNTSLGAVTGNCNKEAEYIPVSENIVSGNKVQYFNKFMYTPSTGNMATLLMFEKNGNNVGFDGTTIRTGNGLIVDYISDDTVSGGEETTEGKPISCYLKGNSLENMSSMVLPDNFDNNNIIELSNNLDSDKQYIMLKYGYSGKVVIIDYTKGEIIADYSDSSTTSLSLSGLLTFAKSYISQISDFLGASGNSDGATLTVNQLESELAKIPDSDMRKINQLVGNYDLSIENQALAAEDEIVDEEQLSSENSEADESSTDNEKISRDYVPVYNSETESYDIYTSKSILESNGRRPISENEKVAMADDKGYELSVSSAIIEQKNKVAKSDMTRIIVLIGIFSVIIVLWFMLRKKLKDTDKQ